MNVIVIHQYQLLDTVHWSVKLSSLTDLLFDLYWDRYSSGQLNDFVPNVSAFRKAS